MCVHMWPQRGQQQLSSWAKWHFCLHSQSKLQLSNNNNSGQEVGEWMRKKQTRGGGTISAHVPEHLRAIELTFAMLKPMGIFVCVCVRLFVRPSSKQALSYATRLRVPRLRSTRPASYVPSSTQALTVCVCLTTAKCARQSNAPWLMQHFLRIWFVSIECATTFH